MGIHEKLYKQLLEIVPEVENPKQYGKSKVSGLMDLSFDLIEKRENRVSSRYHIITNTHPVI